MNIAAPPTAATPELLRDTEAAELCGLSRSGWHKANSAGRVPLPVRIGRATRWRRTELLDWIAAGTPRRDRWIAMRK